MDTCKGRMKMGNLAGRLDRLHLGEWAREAKMQNAWQGKRLLSDRWERYGREGQMSDGKQL
jgi:hypothetical protein